MVAGGDAIAVSMRWKKNRLVKKPISLSSAAATNAAKTPMLHGVPYIECNIIKRGYTAVPMNRLRHCAAAAIATMAAALCIRPVDTQPAPRFDVMEKTIPELSAAMAAGTVTSKALVEAYLARIDAYDHSGPALNAFC